MGKLVYNNKKAVFFKSLKGDVEGYFAEGRIQKTGDWRLYIKSLILILSALALYFYLLTYSYSLPIGMILSSVLGFVLSGIGFNIMHDANHGSYSSKKWVNDLMGLTLNALGSNAFIWKQKHNIIHHTYTNVDGIDDDIAKSPLIRQSSTQVWKPLHRIQHIYLWVIYALSSILWIFVTDFVKYGTRKIYTTELKNMTFKEHFIFWFSKALYIFFYIIIPIAIVGSQRWLVGFICMHITLGLSLAVVFQLAHVVEETEFEFCGDDDVVIENEWAIHQLRTTANFAPGNLFITWFVGGLNYQIEHHLFPRISHVHYPALSKIIQAKCVEFGIQYNSIPTMGSAIASHYRHMRSLGVGLKMETKTSY
ncbi:acyl-CoA desaturase [Flavipsychrobacter stenotrophus]|uniref:Acyl-CoA desaturase n=1 Tax=Flavipsychrobacter stenotrophus TaxID=2077091 RepID=A0A2S7SPY8_9BACT|nr:acyl-CoA desaturase [Flavipsychrobacter stenotrophus]PQJ08952.1 acyl-CoA desaturase [Flavipsychrobacter stenotrophus]